MAVAKTEAMPMAVLTLSLAKLHFLTSAFGPSLVSIDLLSRVEPGTLRAFRFLLAYALSLPP
jgi:hypothetical protein